MKIAFEKIKKK